MSMKLKNIFKNRAKTSSKKPGFEILDKSQLNKVSGGMESATEDRWQKSGIGHAIVVK